MLTCMLKKVQATVRATFLLTNYYAIIERIIAEKEQKELEKLRQEKEDLEFVQELILKGKIDLEKQEVHMKPKKEPKYKKANAALRNTIFEKYSKTFAYPTDTWADFKEEFRERGKQRPEINFDIGSNPVLTMLIPNF